MDAGVVRALEAGPDELDLIVVGAPKADVITACLCGTAPGLATSVQDRLNGARGSIFRLIVDRPTQSGDDRDQAANERDLRAEAHDDASIARDERATARDGRADAREARGDRTGAPADRAGALRDRRGGASDRGQASEDREAALADRRFSADERAEFAIDRLTGAYRREAGFVLLEHEIVRATRTEQPFTLAFVDVNALKQTNDSLGHPAGDELLRAVGDAIRTHLRPYDLTVRYGGDEFLCGLPDLAAAASAERFALVNAELAEKWQASVTVGLAEFEPSETLDELIERADRALYKEKRPSYHRRR